MAVRNCKEIGENLRKIVLRLMSNDTLVNLLFYTDQDPLNQPALTEDQKKKEIYNNLITILPTIGDKAKEISQSYVSLIVSRGEGLEENTEFRDITLTINIFVPNTQWIIKNENLRPFLILGEIQETLKGKTVNGLGKIRGGDFSINFFTEEITCYEQVFYITSYD